MRNKMDIETTHDYWIDAKSRQMWIQGIEGNMHEEEGEVGVEYQMANRVIKNLNILMNQSWDKEILVHLHTCGGIYEEGMAIYDNVKAMPMHVKMLCHTHARSMSSIIFQAADDRVMFPNSTFMFHWGTTSIYGEYKTVVSTIEFSKKDCETMLDIYVDKCQHGEKFEGWESNKIKKYIKRHADEKGDVYLTAEEAVQWGFADRIIETYGEL